RLGIRHRILRDDRVAADERVLADAAELVHPRKRADGGEVLDPDVTAESGGVPEDGVVADARVVRHVDVRHEEVPVADARQATAALRAAGDRPETREGVPP